MKKLLLLASVAFATSAMAQDDITPEAYKFADREVGETLKCHHLGERPWNTDPKTTAQIEELAPEGGFVSVNKCGKYNDASEFEAATMIVDLGGNVGHVLAIAGQDFSGVNDAYISRELGKIAKEPTTPTGGVWQINMYTDPSTTPGGKWLKADWVINAYSSNMVATQEVFTNFYYMTSANDVTPANANAWECNQVWATDFAEIDEEGDPVLDDDENYIYDPTRWLRLSYNCKGLADSDWSTAVKCKAYAGGGFANVVLFVKEIKITVEPEDAEINTDSNVRTYETWNPDPDKVVDAIAKVQALANQKAGRYNMAGQAVSESAKGFVIENGVKKLVK